MAERYQGEDERIEIRAIVHGSVSMSRLRDWMAAPWAVDLDRPVEFTQCLISGPWRKDGWNEADGRWANDGRSPKPDKNLAESTSGNGFPSRKRLDDSLDG